MTQVVRDHRVDFSAPVTLSLPEVGQAVPGFSANISESGIFVTVPEPFTVGEELVCDLPLVGDSLTLRGKVIWVQEVPSEEAEALLGMGVRFLDLSAGDLQALKRFMLTHKGQPQSVVVHFQGYAKPIRASALVTDTGLRLWTALPFLRLQSPVKVAFSGDEQLDNAVERAQRGVLDQVELDLQRGVPRLRIQVGLDGAQGEGETPWLPGQVIYSAPDQPAEDTAAPELSAEHPSAEDDGMPIVDGGLEQRQPEPAAGVVSGVIESAAVDRRAETEQWSTETIETRPADAECCPEWSLGEPASDDSLYDRFWCEAERGRQRLWLWGLALLMAGIALASMVQTEFWNQVSERLWAPGVPTPAAQAALPGSLPDYAPPAAPKLLPPIKVTAVAVAAKPAVKTAKPAAKAVNKAKLLPTQEAKPASRAENKAKQPAAIKHEASQERFKIEREADRASISIPLSGSTKEARHYLLAEPAGVAINLPHGRPSVPLGHHIVDQDIFRAVWIRSRREGTQVRVFFKREPAARPKVSIDDGQISISVTPPER